MVSYKKITSNSGLISIGNTGARVSDPRSTYANILKALLDFRKHNINWSEKDQEEFAKLLTEKEVFDIKDNTVIGKAKDVRVKTGFLSQLGFTTEKRELTEVGKELINCFDSIDSNEFEISKESYIYFKQFLKYQQEGFEVYPLLSLIYCCLEFENNLPINFVTYLWSSSQTESELNNNIKTYKQLLNYKEVVYDSCLKSQNTKIAENNCKEFFSCYKISDKSELKELMYSIIPHGKGKSFKDKTISLFEDILNYWKNKSIWNIDEKKKFIQENLKSRYKDISSNNSSFYLESLFGESKINNTSNWEEIIYYFENTDLISSKDEKSFIVNFHILYMFIKKLSVCFEYKDLNIRHLKLLDIFIFENDRIKIDLIFWYLFNSVKKHLLSIRPLENTFYREKLELKHENIEDIYEFLNINISTIVEKISKDYPEVKEIGLSNFTVKKKEERLLRLVKDVFSKPNIIKIFENIYPRNDKKVREIIKEIYLDYEATIPALFEYLLGISFYWLTKGGVKISDIVKSGLDSNLLPKTHMIGGRADIIINYEKTDYLIEATLSENDGQRKMEAEPVPRHLAKHILEVNRDSLALFVAGSLDPNNLVVLRNYKFSKWYTQDGKNFVENMNILPLSVKNIIYMLKNEIDFKEIRTTFYKLLNSSTTDGFNWYFEEVNPVFTDGN